MVWLTGKKIIKYPVYLLQGILGNRSLGEDKTIKVNMIFATLWWNGGNISVGCNSLDVKL